MDDLILKVFCTRSMVRFGISTLIEVVGHDPNRKVWNSSGISLSMLLKLIGINAVPDASEFFWLFHPESTPLMDNIYLNLLYRSVNFKYSIIHLEIKVRSYSTASVLL